MERGILSVSPDPIPATHEFRCFEEQGKRWSRQGSIMTPEKSHDGMAGRGIVVASTICDWFETGCGNVNYSYVFHISVRHGKAFCVNDVPAYYDQPLLSIEPFTNYRGVAT
ncbi:unnamed protein product [Lasius platythorax]|uniref:Uncharacterized protein n=1 Tax=Lasius platythorax TaxID=488582 RepID=A0AAV2NLG6_9HYME